MKKIFTLCVLMALVCVKGWGQVSVSASGGTTSGSYTTLGAAFTAINGGTHTGVITISVTGNTTETATATLNASGSGSASYTSISIQPTGGATRTITGAITAGSPLIDFSGADNVTINGLNSGGNSLTISNTTASTTSGTATIRFIGGATGNTITNSTILGSFSAAVTTNGGNIYFATDAVTTAGNDNNVISNNFIGPAGANLPTKAIYGNGSTTTVALANSGITISGNNIYDYFGAAVTSTGIYVGTGNIDWSISNNKFYQTASRTQTIGAQHSAIWIANTTPNTSGNNFSISGNTIGYASNTATGTYTFVGLTSSLLVPIYLSVPTGSTTATSVQGNLITAIAMSGAASGTSSSSPFRGIYVAGGLTTIGDVTANTIGSLTATGSITYTSSSTSASDVNAIFNFGSDNWTTNNNNIGGFTVANSSTGASNFYGLRCNTGSGVSWTCTGNTIGGTVANSIQSTSTSTATVVNGIVNNNPIGTITSNTIQNLKAAAGTGTGSSTSVAGIISTSSSTGQSISLNTINTLASAGTTVAGIVSTAGTTNNFFRNKIYDISTSNTGTCTAYGINITGGTTNNIYNNIVGDIRITAGVNTNATPLAALNIAGGTTDNVYYNTLYIGSTTSTGTLLYTASLFASTTPTLNLRNSILVNLSTPVGTGAVAAAYYRSSTTLTTYASTSNNNLFYAGTPSATRLIYFDISNSDQMLAAYKTRVASRDAQSVTENPTFLSTTGSAANYLHISTTVATQIESGGAAISGYANDFDGDTRNATTPDIGADEFTGIASDATAPTISYTALTSLCAGTNAVLTATITDASGVPTSGSGLPVLYYKIGSGSYTAVQGVSIGSSQYTFTFGSAATAGSTVSYYIVAQDNASTPNVGAFPSAGAGGYTANPPAASTAPTSPSTVTAAATLSGTITVGPSGTYTTLTAAVAAYNAACLSGPVVFSLQSGYTSASETFPITINANGSASSTNTLTIKPAVTGLSISGTSTTALIVLNGADYVTIDGSINSTANTVCPASAASKDLTITNTSTGTSSAVVWVQTTSGSDAATNDVVKNCVITGNGAATTLFGVGSGSATISLSSLGTSNNNNSFVNNLITKVQVGVFSQGASAATKNTGTIINQNLINATIGKGGIYVGYENGVTISGNTVTNVSGGGSSATYAWAISCGLQSFTTTTTTGNDVTSATITKNNVGSIRSASTYGVAGIAVASVTSGTTLIANNMVSDAFTNGTSADMGASIYIGGGAGSITNIYYNAVTLVSTLTGGAYSNFGIAINGSNPTVDMRNNIVVSTGSNGYQNRAIGLAYSTYTALTSNYNDFYVSGTSAAIGQTGSLSTTGTAATTLANWQTTTGKDANSQNVLPSFTSATDLRLTTSGNSTLNNAGTTVSVTDDINCATRGSSPDIGVNEFTPPQDDAGITGLVSSAFCPGSQSVGVVLKNYGAVALTSVTINWTVNGVAQTAYNWTGSLATGASTNVTLGSYTFVAATNYTIVATTSSPNGNTDANTSNDSYTSSAFQTALSGTYTVGASGAFATLTAAVAAANANGLCGPTVFSLTDATYSTSETFPIVINAISGASSINTLTIKPASGVSSTITGSSTSAIIKLNGADYVVIEGSNNGTITRNLTITNTSATATAAVIWGTSPSASDGMTSDVIKNCIISGTYTSSTSTGLGYGIITGGTTINSAALAANSNNTIQNNQITSVITPVTIYGGSGSLLDVNNTITGNNIGTSSLTIGFIGLQAIYQSGLTVSLNDIQNISSNGSGPIKGISLVETKNSIVSRNAIHKIVYNGASTTKIYALNTSSGTNFGTVATPSANTFSNNLVYDITSSCTSSLWNTSGINDDGGYGDKFYFNSIYLVAGSVNNSASGGYPVAAFSNGNAGIASTGASAVDIRNNIFSITGTPVYSTGNFYTNYIYSSTYSASTLDNNVDYISLTTGNAYIGYQSSTNYATLAAWQSATGKEAASISADPQFISTTNLQITSGSPTIGAGVAGTGVTVDYTGASRGTPPTIGGYENPATVVVINSVTINPTGSQCTATSRTVTANTTAGTTPITSVVLNYSYNGVAQTGVTMTGGTSTGTSTWTGTIPAATPVNAIVSWTVTATDGITTRTTVGTTYQDAPLTGVTATATASPNPVCAGSQTTLTGVFAKGGGSVTLGSATTTTSTVGITPYSASYEGARSQYLVRASELQALGLVAGNITSLSFNVTASGSYAESNFTIKLGATASSAISGAYAVPTSSYTTVYGPVTQAVPSTGLQTFTFTTPFNWDGASNILVDICHDNDINATCASCYGSNATVQYTTTSFNSVFGSYADNVQSCGTTTSSTISTYTSRPNMTFVGSVSPTFTSYQWSDGTNTVGTTNPLTLIPSATTTYTVKGTDANGCSVTSSGVQVTIAPLPTAPTNATPVNQCGQPTYTATSSISGATFYWYTAATGGTAVTSNTTGIYTPATYSAGTNTIYVSVSNGTCESPRTQIDVNSATPATVTAQANGSATPPSTCLGTPVSLSAVTTGTYTSYTWTASPATGSGIPTSITGQNISVTPTATGTYLYKVTATDGVCTTNPTVSITVNALPTTPTITASAIRVCTNTQVTLTASSGSSSATYCTPSYSYDATDPDYISKVELLDAAGTATLYSRASGSTAAPCYDNQTSLTTATLTAGTTYKVRITNGGSLSENIAVFLDYNSDGVFTGTGETLLSSIAVSSGLTTTATFTVPASAYNGSARLRIVLSYSAAATSCMSTTGYGETEDYNVTITGGTTNPGAATYTWSDGTTTVGAGASITVSPSVTTTYTVTATNSGNCSATSAGTTVTVVSPLSGIYSVGSGNIAGQAGHYSTLTAAVADYNTLCQGGAVTFALTDATYSTAETFPIIINQGSSASATNTLTIKPAAGVTATITGSSASSIIKLNGADYVTIDGSNSGSADKSLTINNTSTAASTAIIWLASQGANAGATNNIIKNINLSTGTTSSATIGIAVEGATISTTGAGEDNDNVTIQNNSITAASTGIYAAGTSANVNDNLTIGGNTISYTGGSVVSIGIRVSQGLNGSISGNTVSASTSASGAPVGISIETGFTSATISKNIVGGITTSATNGYSGRGITIGTGTATSALTLSNNFVYGVNGTNSASFGNSSAIGIAIGIIGSGSTLTTTTGGVNLYNNSISMTGSMGSYSTTTTTTALYVGSGASALNLVDNIFSNTQTATSSTQKNYAVYSAAAATALTSINYNDYYFANSGNAASAILGYLTSDRTTLAAWQAATTQDANSVNLDPVFTSNTDLHINIGNGALDNLGTPVAGVTTDIDNQTRSTTTPDMGADEFTATACVGTSGGTIVYNGGVICTSGSATLTASGYPTGTSVTYQWEYSNNNFASDVHDVTGQTSVPTTTTGTLTSTTYFRLRSTCAATSTIWYSNIVTVTVSSPSIASTTPATRCGTGTVTLQATGSANTDINWYTTSTGGVPVATGTSFTTPVINSTTTYYAEAADASTVTDQAGKPSSTGANGSFINTAWGIVFSATQSVTLNSTIIYPTGTGTITLALLNSAGTELASTPAVTITGGTGVSSPVLVPLGFTVPAGTGYRLVVKAYTGITNLIRDNTGLSYPYGSTSGAVSVTGSWTGSATTGSYYFFYNLVFSTGCKSARTAVTATVTSAPTVSINPATANVCAGSNITLTASSANSGYTYTWTPGNATGATQTYAPAASTTYTVTATDNTTGTYGGCAITATAVITADPAPATVTVTPANTAICAGTVQQLTATGGTYNAETYNESFNSAAPAWTKTNTSTGGTPANADWTLRPNGHTYSILYYDYDYDDYYYEDYQFRNRDSSQFYLSNADAQGYGGITHTTLTSPSINTTNYQSLSLKFNQNFAPYSTGDSAMVQVSTDGTNFTTVAKYTTRQGGETYVTYYYDGDFYEHDIYKETFATATVDLSSYINQPNLYIRFKQDASFGYWWAADSVALTGTHGPKIVWSPVTGLYADAAATTAYTSGTLATTVYAKPTANITYTATASNDINCTSIATSLLTVNPAPVVTVSAGAATCAGSGVNITFTGTPESTVNFSVSGSQSFTGSVILPAGGSTTSRSVSTPTTAGTYTYTITSVTSASSCPGAAGGSVTATVAASPVLTAANGSGSLTQTPCKNSSINTITYTIGGSATGAAISSGSLPTGVSLNVVGNTLTISGAPTVSGTYSFSVTTTGGNCTQATINGNISIAAVITWTGANSIDGNQATNWCGGVPVSTDAVVIPTGLSNYPVLSANISVASLTIQGGATVNIGGHTLTATTISGAGTLTGSPASNLVVNGASTLTFTTGGNTLHDLTIGGGTVSLGNALNITGGTSPGTVTVNNGATLATNDVLTLKSDVNGTASIGQNTSNGTYITGKVTAEHYTDAASQSAPTTPRRAWRLITSPVSGQTIHEAWQENEASNADLNHPYGTIITGFNMPDAGTASGLGYDFTGAGLNSSIRRYDAATDIYVSIPNTLTSVQTEPAYLLFVRGDRSVKTTGAVSIANVRATGTLQLGAKTVNYGATPKVLLGNPYASTIDFSRFITNNSSIKDEFTLWNSRYSYYGAYVTVTHTGSTGGYKATPSPLAGVGPLDDDDYKYIPSGTGFLVVPKSVAAGSVQFRETDKTPGSKPPVSPFRVVNTPGNLRELVVNLNLKDTSASATLADGFRALFSPDYEGNEDDNSSVKSTNLYENLGLTRSNTDLIIEARGEVKKTDTLYMKMWNVVKRKYQFQVKGDNFASAPGIRAWLEDSYLHTSQEVALDGSITTTDFEVNTDSGSAVSDRFRIVFENSSITLPVTITKVSAQPKNGGAEVVWTVANETNIKGYTVEKSTDGGRTFTSAGTQQPARNNPQAAVSSYSGYDAQPVIGDNYYRIRIEAKDGTITYSTVVKVTIGQNGSSIQITLYPNPVREGKANLKLTNLKEGAYLVSVYSGSGQTVYQKKVYITLEGTTQTEQLIMGNSLAQGSYQIKMADSKGTVIFNDQLIIGR